MLVGVAPTGFVVGASAQGDDVVGVVGVLVSVVSVALVLGEGLLVRRRAAAERLRGEREFRVV